MDHCLARYNLVELGDLIIAVNVQGLVDKGYPEEMLDFDFEEWRHLCLNNLVFDVTNGTLLKLSKDQVVTHALQGFKVLSENKIRKIYGSPPVFKSLKFPEKQYELAKEAESHYIMMTYFVSCQVPIVCLVVDYILKK